MCYAILIVTQLNENGIFGIVAVVTLTGYRWSLSLPVPTKWAYN